MAGNDTGDRTERPTERRRSEARQKGNVAKSVDLTAAGLMLAAAMSIYWLGMPLTRSLAELLYTHLSGPVRLDIDRSSTIQQFWNIAKLLADSVLPIMLLMMTAALLFNLMQVGFLMATEVLQPKFARLNPVEGAKRILSLRALVKLGVSLGKLLTLAAIATWCLASLLPHFLNMTDFEWTTLAQAPSVDPFREKQPVMLIMLQIEESLVSLAFQLALALIVLALVDFGFQKWKYEQDLQMTKQEVREEMKSMEGDPLIRQRRRESHRKLALARELRQVQDADVVITNPTEIAVALKYDPQKMSAPMLVAKGMGEIAARIRRIAVEHGVPIIERKTLAQALYRHVKMGQPIPVAMYEVFVEIMAYVYRLTGRTPESLDRH